MSAAPNGGTTMLSAFNNYNTWRQSMGMPPVSMSYFVNNIGTSLPGVTEDRAPSNAGIPPSTAAPVNPIIAKYLPGAVNPFAAAAAAADTPTPIAPAPVPQGQGIGPVGGGVNPRGAASGFNVQPLGTGNPYPRGSRTRVPVSTNSDFVATMLARIEEALGERSRSSAPARVPNIQRSPVGRTPQRTRSTFPANRSRMNDLW